MRCSRDGSLSVNEPIFRRIPSYGSGSSHRNLQPAARQSSRIRMLNSTYFLSESSTRLMDGLIVALANRLAGKDKCESMDLPDRCVITGDCSQITCNPFPSGEPITLRVTINRYDTSKYRLCHNT